MIRPLVMIAAAGLVLSACALSAAVMVAGPEAALRGGWTWNLGEWGNRWWDGPPEIARGDGHWSAHDLEPTSRTLAWRGADRLVVDLWANVRYVQADGPGRVVVTGPRKAVERAAVRGDTLRYRSGRHRSYPRLDVVILAPNVTSFDISRRSALSIESYDQPRLNADVSDDAALTAEGVAGELNLDVTGKGAADLARLKVARANIDVAGSGAVTVAPTELARLGVAGWSNLRLLTRPKRIETHISGEARITRAGF